MSVKQEAHLPKWDLFISYASEDRETVVAPLVEALRSRGLKIWYDVFELTPGKFLLRSIDEGLRESKFGIVVLSPNFFAKEWPMRELSGLHSRSIQEGNRPLVPIWYNLSALDIAHYSPIMSDVVAIRWEEGLENVVQTILALVKPEMEYTSVQLRTKVYGEIYQAFSKQDYVQKITKVSRDYPSHSIKAALVSILSNERLSARIRVRSLQMLIKLGLADDFDTVLREENTDLLRELITFFTEEDKVILSKEQVELLFSNPRLPRASNGLGEMIREFIRRGANYTTSIFLAGATYPSWEVKYDCVKTIINIDDEDSLQTLASFSTMSYWVARKRIIAYIRRRIEDGSMSTADKSIAQQILAQIITDDKTSKRTPTMRRAREALELLQGKAASKDEDKIISVLFLSADPTDASRLRLGEEFREIQEKIQLARQRERFDLHLRTSIRPEDITQAMLDIKPTIVHFSGHGTDTGELCFEHRSGVAQLVSPEAIASLFSQFSQSVNCVILNACYSERQAQAISEFVPYVIGMKQAIGDRAAIVFSIGFYQALGAGLSIEDAYKLGCVQIGLQGIGAQLTPVLLTKGQVINYS